MIEIPVAKNIFKYKAKVTGNLSARELGFSSLGIILVFLIWFSLPSNLILAVKTILCLVPMLLCILIGFLPIQNEPIEKILPRIINDSFLCKRHRTKEIKFEYKKPVILSVKESKEFRKVK